MYPVLMNIAMLSNIRPGSVSVLEDVCARFSWLAMDCSVVISHDKERIQNMLIIVTSGRTFCPNMHGLSGRDMHDLEM